MNLDKSSTPQDFEGLWTGALERYKGQTGHALPPADDFPSRSRDPDEIVQYIDRQGREFKEYRTEGARIRRVLKPIVNIVLPFLDAGAEWASVRTTSLGTL